MKKKLIKNELNEKEQRRLYNERVPEIERESITLLVMSATGRMGQKCKKFYSHLAEMISSTIGTGYNIAVAWIRRKITGHFKGHLKSLKKKSFFDCLQIPGYFELATLLTTLL